MASSAQSVRKRPKTRGYDQADVLYARRGFDGAKPLPATSVPTPPVGCKPRGGSSPLIRIAKCPDKGWATAPGSTRACFIVALLLARNLSRHRADVPALEAQKRTGGCQPDTRPCPADRTRRELLGAEPLMQVEIGHRCGRRADFHIVRLDAASDNGPNGLSRVEKSLHSMTKRSSISSCGTTRIGSSGPGRAESLVAEGV